MALPSLTGLVPYPVEQVLRALHAQTEQLQGELARLARTPPVPTLASIRQALSATGSTPLNIFQLVGGGATTGVLDVGTHAQRLARNPSSVPTGMLFYETDRRAIYLAYGTPQVWNWIHNAPLGGLLDPDQKPTDLGVLDIGFHFYATDFNRSYAWTGAAWADALLYGADTRGMILWFDDVVLPTDGWALCDGSVVTRTTPTGGIDPAYTTPDLITDARFIRAVAGATRGVGGSATTHTHPVDPPSTASGGPSGTVEVQSGAGTTVADDTHTHAVDIASFTSGTPSGAGGDDALPPYMNMRPYVRL